jgi:uncharacterized GH25 family protein
MQSIRRAPFIALMIATPLIVSSAKAHEFIVKPDKFVAKAGETVSATVYSTHAFIKGEEIEDAGVTNAFIVSGGNRAPISLQADQAKLIYAGTVSFPSDKAVVLSGRRSPIYLATTPEGSKRGTRKDFPDARQVRAIEKFSKAFINASADDDVWSKPVGDRLEIMVRKSPASIKAGDEIPVQALFDGKPIATKLYATYDGFSARNMTFAFYAEMEESETGYVKITQPGTWIIRVEHIDDTKSADIDRYIARAVLLLDVK